MNIHLTRIRSYILRNICTYALHVALLLMIVTTLCIQPSSCDSSTFNETVSNKTNKKPEKVLRLVKFNHQSCNDSIDYLLDIEDISITSNASSRRQEVIISFTGELKTDIDAPIEVDINVRMRLAGIWVPFPCVRRFGSCRYDDACALASKHECQEQAINNGLPCKCPVKKGKFKISSESVELPSSALPGSFIIVANVTQGSESVLCQEMYARLKWFKLDDDDDDKTE